jgi:hypothetical protein
VVENRDSAQLADLAEALGEADVLLRWIRVSAYVELPITGVMQTLALCGDLAYRPSAHRWECSA